MGLLKGSAGLGGLESAPFRCDACAAGEREDEPRRVRSSETRTFTTGESVCAAAFVALLQLCAAINWLRWPVNIYMLEKPFLGFICMMVKCVMLCVCVCGARCACRLAFAPLIAVWRAGSCRPGGQGRREAAARRPRSSQEATANDTGIVSKTTEITSRILQGSPHKQTNKLNLRKDAGRDDT